MACWYLDVFFPLVTLGHAWLSGWMFYALALPGLVLFPVLFCRLRYTEQAGKYSLLGTTPGRRAGSCGASGRPALPSAALRGR